ncbi:metallopeptidase [Dorcoceras hygrometricum]|uniref:Metallopeptidase n=1 Tax=Dorcoceras hygrometricum TaxID=472368 RepID=A0A2Z7A2J8_9LAMI|nr:metallopeptidase [Dorcoceras hygrometricum]
MVLEYKKLSQSFELVKVERESCATNAELVGSRNIQAALSKLVTENEELRSKSKEMLNENQRLAGLISSWTRSSVSLQKLHGATKTSGDRTGFSYNSDEGSTSQTSSTPRLERTNFRTMNFVKSSTKQPEEAHSGEVKIAAETTIWKGRFCGLGYTAPEKPRESWLNKRIVQMRGKPKYGGIKKG